MKYVVGIDVGTTGTKAVLLREDGKIVGQAYCGYSTYTPKAGYCEQNPEDWWNSVCSAVKQVTDDASVRSGIAAVSMSTQGGTTVCTDEYGKALRPAMVWSDHRCGEELEQMKKDIGELDVYRICGWHPSDAMPALQCRWLKKHEPEIFNKISRFLSVPDYLSYRMTGRAVIDVSNAGICRFADVRTGEYHPKIVEYAGLSREMLADILPSGVPIGTISAEAAAEMELPKETVLVSGAHDQYAAAIGAGAFESGDFIIGAGTSWVIVGLSESPDFDSRFAQSVSAVKGLWGSLRSLSSGGVCIEWLRNKIASETGEEALSYDTLNREISCRRAAEEELFFFPFSGLCGDKKFFRRAAFYGMDLSHDKFHLARAIMEGVALQIRWMMEGFHTAADKGGIVLAGGASKSEVWSQIVADTLGMPVRISDNPQLSCIGAAILAGTGCGIFSDVKSGYGKLETAKIEILPDPVQAEKYRMCYDRYREFAARLGDMYRLK